MKARSWLAWISATLAVAAAAGRRPSRPRRATSPTIRPTTEIMGTPFEVEDPLANSSCEGTIEIRHDRGRAESAIRRDPVSQSAALGPSGPAGTMTEPRRGVPWRSRRPAGARRAIPDRPRATDCSRGSARGRRGTPSGPSRPSAARGSGRPASVVRAATRPSASPGATVKPQPAWRIVSADSQWLGPTKRAGRPAAMAP